MEPPRRVHARVEALRPIGKKIAARLRHSENGTAGGARPPSEVMVAFIIDQGARYGDEPICRVLPLPDDVSPDVYL